MIDAFQVAVHAIGDKANDEVVAAFSRAAMRKVKHLDEETCQAPQHRVEHAQHLSGQAAVEAFGTAGLSVVANPLHIVIDKVCPLPMPGPAMSPVQVEVRPGHE